MRKTVRGIPATPPAVRESATRRSHPGASLRRSDDKKCPHGFYGGLAPAPSPAPPDDGDDDDSPTAPAAAVPGGSS